ncbi:ankyrin repeat domain-containing protein [Arthrobacter sp. AL12]|uniref:ankyrin repeat domain-containing protein n=1 Tax=Arthrobacter sp. AL12 TaxID=3042241 RepID=UPI00249CD780|nr:ankyrin repeat domain-containing protein [Arthrobacter sp. AL12]MDI3210872.1 ankyrin repeat domain-containing protein [Arthrobacter sp. AL12]
MIGAAVLGLTSCGAGTERPLRLESPTDGAVPGEAQAALDRRLVQAAKANDAGRVAELIRAGGDVNAKDPIQDSAFLYAGAEGFNEVLRLTLANGAAVASGGPSQQDVVAQLLAAGADPTIPDPQGRTALENAERLGFSKIVDIIKAGPPTAR